MGVSSGIAGFAGSGRRWPASPDTAGLGRPGALAGCGGGGKGWDALGDLTAGPIVHRAIGWWDPGILGRWDRGRADLRFW